MKSVYEKHKGDWHIYKSAFAGDENCARLMFAQSILSDIYEMCGDGRVREEITEVKELLGDVLRDLLSKR